MAVSQVRKGNARPAGPTGSERIRKAETRVISFDAKIGEMLASARSGKAQRIDLPTLDHGWASRLSDEEISRLIVPKRTLARRRARKEDLTAEESDRAFRIGRIIAQADRVFGNPEKVDRWLRRSNPALNGKSPLDVLESEAGAHVVDELLGQIAHGMFI
jgi:putative toxin-antitoxin system antitoxin component (TIGR02293 family)